MVETVGGLYVLVNHPPRTGGFAVVYKAFDPNDNAAVAVKLMARTENPHQELAVARELESLRKLSHPNIIRLKDAGVDESRNSHYLVLDWVDDSLANILKSKGPYEWGELADQVAMPLVQALAYAHLKGVEHRDIKPHNVLITRAGVPLLADFGIAKVAQGAANEHTVIGFQSGVYTPPEQDGTVKYVRDVYSMGVLLIRAMHQDALDTFADIESALQAINVPPDARKLLARCVDPDHTQRPANGAILADELANILRGRSILPVASRSTLWLELTRNAERQLLEHPHEAGATAEAVVLEDLNDDVFAEYRYDPAKRATDHSTDLTLAPDLTADDAHATADALLGTSASVKRFLALVELQAEWLQRTRSDHRLAEAFLGTAKVVAGTCIGFVGQSAVRDLEIDLCIFDEASKATATEALVPLARSRRAILVGDINQLPPQEEELLRSKEILVEHGIDRELVEETLFKWFSDRLPDHSKFRLRDQYRMIAPIGDLVSTCFYAGELHSPRTEGLRGYELLGKPGLLARHFPTTRAPTGN